MCSSGLFPHFFFVSPPSLSFPWSVWFIDDLLATPFNIPGVLCFSVTLCLTDRANTLISSYFANLTPTPRARLLSDFFRRPLFTPLTNYFVSCPVIFLLFTLRLFLPFSCFKKMLSPARWQEASWYGDGRLEDSWALVLGVLQCWLRDLDRCLLGPRSCARHCDGEGDWSCPFLRMYSLPQHNMEPLEQLSVNSAWPCHSVISEHSPVPF